jgi:neutral ceramidase
VRKVLTALLFLALAVGALPAARALTVVKGPACGTGVFCAGAATGDITPPVTSPQWAYTLRACPVAVAAESAAHSTDPQDHLEEGQAWLLGGGPTCLGSKASPDTELYAKTWPPSQGYYGRLQANAFVLDDGKGQRVALVQVDLGGVPGELHEAVSKRLAAVGIDRSHLLISATHTHGSVGGMWQSLGYAALGGDAYDPRIFEAVAAGLTDAVVRAAAQLRPARLAMGYGSIADANHNRRSGAWRLDPESIGPDADPLNAPRLGVIRLDTVDGLPIGVITNFANHGVIHETFNYYFSGDNQGTTTRMVARGIAADAAARGVDLPKGWKVVDALLNGAPGDITPSADDAGWDYDHWGYDDANDYGAPFGQFAKMENGGMRQAPETLRVWRSLESSLTSDVTLDARFDYVCFCGQAVPDDPYDAFDQGPAEPASAADDPAYRSVSVEAILGSDAGESLPTTAFPGHHHEQPRLVAVGSSPQVVRIQLLRINDLALAAMPGEPTIQMGRRIERSIVASSGGLFKDALTIGLANDYVSYMATVQEYEAYQYEGGFSLYGQQTGNLLKSRLVDMVGHMRAGSPMEPCTVDRGCVTPPDTSSLAAAPLALTPDVGAGVAVTQPANAARFVGTSFEWAGGGPAAEWSQNDALVELQKRSGFSWKTVATDLDFELPVHYVKSQGVHHWTAFFDPTKDWAEGTYRFHVTGHRATGPAMTEPYVLDSASFKVSRSGALGLVRLGDGTLAASHPAPDPLANFRYRDRVAATATVGGVPVASAGLVPGQVVPAGAIVDAWGNTNAKPVVVP